MAKRPVLGICVECTNGEGDPVGESLFRAVKKERKKRDLKALFKIEALDCLDRCEMPCNAQLRGKKKPTLELTELDAARDAVPLLEAMVRYAEAEGEPAQVQLKLPGEVISQSQPK
jgi:predicted metal-binding protein